MRQGDMDGAIQDFEDILNTEMIEAINPSTIEFIRFAYTICLLRNNQLLEAQQQSALILMGGKPVEQDDSMFGFRYLLKSIIEILQGKYSEALKSSKKAVFTEENVMLFPIGAVAANLSGHYEEALEILDEYSNQTPLNAQQKAMFTRLKKALKLVDRDPQYSKINLPQENMDRLKHFLNYTVILSDVVSPDSDSKNTFTINLNLKNLFRLSLDFNRSYVDDDKNKHNIA